MRSCARKPFLLGVVNLHTIRMLLLSVAFVVLYIPSVLAVGNTVSGVMEEGRVYVPAQSVFEELGCQVIWDKTMQILLLKKGDIRLTIDVRRQEALVSGKPHTMPYPPKMEQNTILVPLRFCVETLGMKVEWNDEAKQAIVFDTVHQTGKSGGLVIPVFVRAAAPAPVVSIEKSSAAEKLRTYSKGVNGHLAQVVEIAPHGLIAELGLADDRVGSMEEMGSITSRLGASAAINGSYFAAYGGAPDPWNLLIRGGKVLHVSSNGTAIGFTRTGQVKMAAVKVKIEGATNGSYQWPNNWYAYGFNHTADKDSVYIYTPERGKQVGFSGGTAVIVANGHISNITANNNVPIPANGFVAVFSGSERSLLERFRIGSTASYRIVFEGTEGESWDDVITAVGAGPRLITRGKITVDPVGEGFSEAKIIEGSGARSAIGVRRDGTVLLVTTGDATMGELARMMDGLGCWQAMNLDGGASSGLWAEGHYITEPGRALSNVLIFR